MPLHSSSYLWRLLPNLAVLLRALVPFCAKSEPETFRNSGDGFDITFQGGWEVMPSKRLAEFYRKAEVQHPEWKRPAMHYAYQMTNASKFTFAPYVLVRASTKTQIPDLKARSDALLFSFR